MAYLAFRDDDYTSLRRDLLRVKGSNLQKKFLEVTRDSASFVAWIEKYIRLKKNGDPFDVQEEEQLSEQEYKEPPKNIEKVLFERWHDLTPAQASEETFWGCVTLEYIKEGIIQAPYLAANGGSLPGGLERIDEVLAGKKGEEESKSIDSIVRTILRRFGGLPEARGAKSVYVNCPFARAWWRGYVAREVCKATEANYGKVVDTLRASQEFWERLIVLIVSRNSVLGDTNVRTALIWALSELVEGKNEDENKKQLFQVKTLKNISRQIGIRSAWQEMGIFPVEELKRIMDQQFLSRFTACSEGKV